MKNERIWRQGVAGFFWMFAAVVTGPAFADEIDTHTGPNMSGESTGAQRTQLFKDDSIRKEDNMRIEVPRMPDGRPMRPVRGLSRTESMELDDLEHRYNQGLIGEAEYFSRRNAIMERVGLEAEY